MIILVTRYVGVLITWLALAVAAAPAGAQTAPSPADVAGFSALQAAAHRGDLATLGRLLATADKSATTAALAARDGNGRTALHIATFARQREALKRLAAAAASLGAEPGTDPGMGAGANPRPGLWPFLGALDHDRYDAVTIAAVANDEDTLRLLLQLGASAKLITSRYDGTALIAAAHLGHDGVVRQLIAAGAPLDHVNKLHWTAVIEAIVLGDGGARHQACLHALLAAGANPNLADRSGRTPLALARERGHGAMVAMLERAGARP